MPRRLFVSGLSFSTTSDRLRAAFATAGAVDSATIATDRATGRSRGFGFVEMATDAAADETIRRLNGSDLDGRRLRVEFATRPGERDRTRAGRRRGFDDTRRAPSLERPGPPSAGDQDQEIVLVVRHHCVACNQTLVGFLLGRRGTEPTLRQQDDVRDQLIEFHAKECVRAPAARPRRTP